MPDTLEKGWFVGSDKMSLQYEDMQIWFNCIEEAENYAVDVALKEGKAFVWEGSFKIVSTATTSVNVDSVKEL